MNGTTEQKMTLASQSIEDFKECLYQMQEARKAVTNEILETGHVEAEKVQIFRQTLKEMCDERTSHSHIRDIHSRGTTFGINIQDEIKGLEKDRRFLDLFANKTEPEETLAAKLKLCDLPGLLSSYALGSKFIEEVKNCKCFLLDLIDTSSTDGIKPLFITDWDGTMKDYCSQYATNLQPAYSAVVMGVFARFFTRVFAVLTAGPLRHPGILDLTALPINGPVLFSGSWGREWWLGGRRVVHDDGIPEEGSVAIGQLYEQLEEILGEGEFVQFALVGSGVQRKVDRLTLGVQTVFGQVPPELSARYIDAVKERIHRVDPNSQYLVLENCSPLEIEVCVHSSGTVWNKGDGVSALVESLHDSLKIGKVCVAGDTASDVPMLQRAANENPEQVRALFVDVSKKLKETITGIVGDPDRVCFVSSPDVVHAAFAQIICDLTAHQMLGRATSQFFKQKRFTRLIQTGFEYEHKHDDKNYYYKYAYIGGATTAGLLGYQQFIKTAKAEHVQDDEKEKPITKLEDLPMYKQDDVKQHGRNAERIWVTYKDGVYDVTDFVAMHPGGDKILLAAGAAVDPFWALYSQHKTAEVLEILEGYRIGRLDVKDVPKDNSDPFGFAEPDAFSNDPERHPALLVRNAKPFNAESPPSLLTDHFYTPNELFFVRNHLPVPDIKSDEHVLTVQTLNGNTIDLSVDELKKKYKAYTIGSVIQCAGNRRADMHQYKKVQGLMWEGTAISNAEWTGVRLRDLLKEAGIDVFDENIKHVHFEGADVDPTGTPYGASIPMEKARENECIVAYHMNGVDIPRDHGAPLRAIVPGNVGARQVKWLRKIIVSERESDSHWQQKDYRAFSPAVNIGDELKWETVPSIQEYPVQCVICSPAPNTKVDRDDGIVDISGYAWSGGGRGIIRIEVSVDGGESWSSVEMEQEKKQDLEHMYAWTLFRAEVKIPPGVKEFNIIAKAVDRAYNTQPETASGIWNVRGLIHNAWHKVPITVND
ncbi:unnamed protein product [Caenorhabditis sp. 36 PRJEB53466]|nr:unnamed protein product [Caenorhabditis sp. 36 PRJEB53466]